MSQSLKSLVKISAAAASLGLLAGCASQADPGMDSQLDEAMQMASEAQATARDANSKATMAQQSAEQAKSMAKEAQGTAKSAQYTADQNAKKIDNMFKKSMMK